MSTAAPSAGPLDPERARGLPTRTVVDFAIPTIGVGMMFFIVSLYMMIFATDVLLIPPGAMGLIFGFSRIWDAVSDPVAGYWSDRTHTRFGRRRPWLLASIPAVTLSFGLMWSPPGGLEGPALVAWMAVTVLAFYTAMTIFVVPHQALGAELTSDTHARSRIFAYRHVIWSLGSVLALVLMQWLIDLESGTRGAASAAAWTVAACTAGLIGWAVARLRERPEYQGRGSHSPWRAFRDVWDNVPARVLLLVFGIESLGGATIGILTPYVARYIVHRPDLTYLFILAYMVPTIAATPIWVPLSRRFGKKPLWVASMLLTVVAFGGMMSIGENTYVRISLLACLGGLAASCGSIMSPSIQSDVIDVDEHRTDQRKEGAYFAAWNFVFKSATGVMLALTGFVLDFAGFVPNVEQSDGTRFAILALFSLFPATCYAIGAALMHWGFRLDEATHARLQAEILERADR